MDRRDLRIRLGSDGSIPQRIRIAPILTLATSNRRSEMSRIADVSRTRQNRRDCPEADTSTAARRVLIYLNTPLGMLADFETVGRRLIVDFPDTGSLRSNNASVDGSSLSAQRCNPGPTSAEEDEYDQPSCSALEFSAPSDPIAADSRRPANDRRWQPILFVRRLW